MLLCAFIRAHTVLACSDTKAGRATVIKTIGEDGDRVITSLYEACKAGSYVC